MLGGSIYKICNHPPQAELPTVMLPTNQSFYNRGSKMNSMKGVSSMGELPTDEEQPIMGTYRIDENHSSDEQILGNSDREEIDFKSKKKGGNKKARGSRER